MRESVAGKVEAVRADLIRRYRAAQKEYDKGAMPSAFDLLFRRWLMSAPSTASIRKPRFGRWIVCV